MFSKDSKSTAIDFFLFFRSHKQRLDNLVGNIKRSVTKNTFNTIKLISDILRHVNNNFCLKYTSKLTCTCVGSFIYYLGHTMPTGSMTGRSIDNYSTVVFFSVVFLTFLNFAIGLDFTTDGKYMALAERRNCKDCISIFACTSWQLVKV